MIQKEFFPNKTALVTLIAACLVVIISLGIRQTFGLFFFVFKLILVVPKLNLDLLWVYNYFFGDCLDLSLE